MHQSFRILSLSASIAIATNAFCGVSDVSALTVSGPFTKGNLAMYLIQERTSPGLSVITLDAALKSGQAKIVHEKGWHTVQNFSAQTLFVPFGTLLKGGTQDQVIGASLIVPPHSGALRLNTFCVDPFRSSARSDVPSNKLVGMNLRIPSQAAKLSMLAGGEPTRVVSDIRQSGVWWGLDRIEAKLAAKVGHPLASPRSVEWTLGDDQFASDQLRQRTGTWVNSLPLALQDRGLGALERPILSALDTPAVSKSDVIGAAFAINGHWVGATINATHDLFKQTWPATVRAYAVESLVEDGQPATAAPSATDMTAMIEAARRDVTKDRVSDDMTIFENNTAMLTLTQDRGRIIQADIIPKLDSGAAASTPAGLVISMLQTGTANGQGLNSLKSAPTLERLKITGGSRDGWSIVLAKASSANYDVMAALRARIALRSHAADILRSAATTSSDVRAHTNMSPAVAAISALTSIWRLASPFALALISLWWLARLARRIVAALLPAMTSVGYRVGAMVLGLNRAISNQMRGLDIPSPRSVWLSALSLLGNLRIRRWSAR